MAVTNVMLANAALSELGDYCIETWGESSAEMDDINEVWEYVLRETLNLADWKFALAQAQLAHGAGSPTLEFENDFDMPSDWIRTVRISDRATMDYFDEWSQVGNQIHANADDLFMEYVAYTETYANFPSNFQRVFVARLAYRIAKKKSAPDGKQQALFQLMNETQRAVLSIEGTQSPPRKMRPSGWVSARYQSV
jgi:hypothetical protein